MSEHGSKIKNYIVDNMGIDLENIGDAEPLFTSGVLDSFALMELLAFMEQDLGADIDFTEIYIEKIDSIDSLAALVG